MILHTSNSRTKHHICRDCHTVRMKKYRRTDSGAEKTRKANKESTKRNFIKQQARMKVKNAIRYGKIIRPERCSMCNTDTMVEGHHNDYSKELEVTWVCRKCHADIHKKIDMLISGKTL